MSSKRWNLSALVFLINEVTNTTNNQMKIWSSHLLDNLSNCLMNLKNSGDSTGFEPMTSAMPVQCSNQLSYEVTQLRAGQFVGLMFSRERNVVWKMCYMKCGVWNQMKIWSSHLLDNLRQLLKLSSKCKDHISIWFQTPHFIGDQFRERAQLQQAHSPWPYFLGDWRCLSCVEEYVFYPWNDCIWHCPYFVY